MTGWSDVPCVFIVAPACPHCGALRPATMRSVSNGDGSITRLSTCRTCLQRFKVVVEPPEPTADPKFGGSRKGNE